MRCLAHKILLASLLAAFPSYECLAEEHRSLKSVGQVKVGKKSVRNGAVPFRPELSLEENNQNQLVQRSRTTSISLVIPWHRLAVEGTQDSSLVNRPFQLEIQGEVYRGRISGIMIDRTDTATVFAQIEHSATQRISLDHEETGVLSIGE